jgi:hypothetical protein
VHTCENDDLLRIDHVEDEIWKTMNDCSSDSAADGLTCSRILRDASDRRADLFEKFITQAGAPSGVDLIANLASLWRRVALATG